MGLMVTIMDTNKLDLMVDFETMGTAEDSVILSMGLCLFNRETGLILEEWYEEFDVLEQLKYGATVDPATVAWWLRTDPEEYTRLLEAGYGCSTPSGSIPFKLSQWEGDYENVWSRGCMDGHIIGYHYEGLEYWRFKDVRTLDIFGIKMDKNGHRALDDCKNQVAYVTKVLGACRGL